MIDPELQTLENELKKLKPARLREESLARLARAGLEGRAPASPSRTGWLEHWRQILAWLAAAAATAAIMGLVVTRDGTPDRTRHLPATALDTRPTLQADKVEVDENLVTSFDAVAKLPNGEPVRFRCRQWMDEVKLKDSSRGVSIERKVPRLEVVSVKYDTY
jgi:hypothetical protein